MPPGPPVHPIADNARHILIVDDDARLRDLLKRFLAKRGHRVALAGDTAQARRQLQGLSFDLIILDVMMPGEDGFTFLAEFLTARSVPVILLTARGEASDRVRGLELGAEDYLAKPFEPNELALRVDKILRRTAQPPHEAIRFGPFLYDIGQHYLTNKGEPVPLTEREARLLHLFAERPGETIARHLLIPPDGGASERAIDVQINRLRRKVEPDPANPRHLQTVRGIGYRLLAEPLSDSGKP